MRNGWAFEPSERLLLILLTLALSLPFLGKAVHIDDPVVLQVAANVIEDPLDPYKGEMDWFGHLLPLWRVTTNPPLLSYWLAPAALLSGSSEWALHLAMAPFLLMMAAAMLLLARRFTDRAWLPLLFALTSPAVWVSMNLMRDVPAAALTWLGVALFVRGTDRERVSLLAVGSALCGLAALTKYSAAVGIPLLAVYPLLKGRRRCVFWIWPAAGLLAGWIAMSWFLYGQAHPFYLLTGQHPNSPTPLLGKFSGAMTTVGSAVFLTPALIAACGRRRRVAAGAAAAAVVMSLWALGPAPGAQYLFWVVVGAAFLFLCLFAGAVDSAPLFSTRTWADPERAGAVSDSAFLLTWAAACLAFSVLFVQFQAVRHLIPAVAPLVLLSFRALGRTRHRSALSRWTEGAGVAVLLCLQISAGLLVGFADSQYASAYRDFARNAAGRWKSERFVTWYVGHWGWMHYAQRAGFRQMHRDGPLPQPGDVLLWPERVHVGDAFARSGDLRERLELIEAREYGSRLPVRTMNFRCAAFYALVRRNLPYCVQTIPLETMRVYRVR